MHSSSVLLVHPSADRFRLPDMANGKMGSSRHYSLDSPSLTSPPGYELDQKPPMLSMPSTCSAMQMQMQMPIQSSPHAQFQAFNPHHLVMTQTAPPGLLHLGKSREANNISCFLVVSSALGFITSPPCQSSCINIGSSAL